MDKKQRTGLLKAISDHQMGEKMRNSRFFKGGCSGVTLKIGGTAVNGQVEHDVIHIIDSSASIVTLVTEWAKANDCRVSMSTQGLRVS